MASPSNSLADTLDSGDVALGLLDNTYSPTVVEFCGELGLGFVWLDMEHGGPDPWDATAVEDLSRAAERTDLELLVRLPDTDPTLVRKALLTAQQRPSTEPAGQLLVGPCSGDGTGWPVPTTELCTPTA